MRAQTQRTPTNDSPPSERFDHLLGELENHGYAVQDWVNKFVAHAACSESRLTLKSDSTSLSLAKLWTAERAIVRAADFVGKYFVDGSGIGGVPVPQFAQFQYLDERFVPPEAIRVMEDAWEQHTKEINKCAEWTWSEPLIDDIKDS